MSPFKEEGVYCFANVGPSVVRSIENSRPKDLLTWFVGLAQGSSKFVWWLVLSSK